MTVTFFETCEHFVSWKNPKLVRENFETLLPEIPSK